MRPEQEVTSLQWLQKVFLRSWAHFLVPQPTAMIHNAFFHHEFTVNKILMSVTTLTTSNASINSQKPEKYPYFHYNEPYLL